MGSFGCGFLFQTLDLFSQIPNPKHSLLLYIFSRPSTLMDDENPAVAGSVRVPTIVEGPTAASSSEPQKLPPVNDQRVRFTVELRPGETTIVSWKRLLKESGRGGGAAAVSSGVDPALGGQVFSGANGIQNYKSFKQIVRRLEEASVSFRGVERTQLLRRWLVALKDIERMSADSAVSEQSQSSDEPDSPRNISTVLLFDSDMEG